jgi:hypothetical protein
MAHTEKSPLVPSMKALETLHGGTGHPLMFLRKQPPLMHKELPSAQEMPLGAMVGGEHSPVAGSHVPAT